MAVKDRDVMLCPVGIIGAFGPRVDAAGRGVVAEVEYLYDPLPNRFTSECLFDRHALDVRRVRPVKASDHIAQFLQVRHAFATSTSGPTVHGDDTTSAAIAGVQRMVTWLFTRL